MLPAANRLRSSSDFAATIRGGRRVGRSTLVVHLAVPSKPEQPGRASLPGLSVSAWQRPACGFVVSKAVGGAVMRNAVKRRLRHLMASRIDHLPPGSTVVVRALPSAATAAYRTLEVDLDSALMAAQRPRRGRGVP